jgi:NAD(P)-dependent dehydrogenase (short-subunit alcohol dehydrogenase family)
VDELRFDGRVVAVTGAGRGIGRSHARLLAQKGARVVIAGLTPGPVDEVVREITENGGQATPCYGSVADEADANAVIATAIDTYGRIDAIVNNAGSQVGDSFAALSTAQFRAMIDVHYFGTVFVTRSAWPYFVEQGYGRVVNTVSDAMFGGLPEQTSYGGAKGAVLGLTRTLAAEGAPHGIAVNAIAPRAYTRLSAQNADAWSAALSIPQEMVSQINASMPPELCAPAAAYLAHETCSLNGEALQVGMGGVARIAVVVSKGIHHAELTAEHIAANLDALMDISDARVTNSTSLL